MIEEPQTGVLFLLGLIIAIYVLMDAQGLRCYLTMMSPVSQTCIYTLCATVQYSLQANISLQTVASLSEFAKTTNVCPGGGRIGIQPSQRIHWYGTMANPNKRENSCSVWLFHFVFRMTGEAITGSWPLWQSPPHPPPGCSALLHCCGLVWDIITRKQSNIGHTYQHLEVFS